MPSARERVRVTGTLADSFGLVLGVQPTAIESLGTDAVPHAQHVRTAHIDEESEGRLVRIRGTVTDDVFDDAPFRWIFHVDDGSGPITIFVYTGTGIDVSEVDHGDEIEVTGFSGQFLDHYEIDPRFQSDLDLGD
jgi:RecJ-like exonuclease